MVDAVSVYVKAFFDPCDLIAFSLSLNETVDHKSSFERKFSPVSDLMAHKNVHVSQNIY